MQNGTQGGSAEGVASTFGVGMPSAISLGRTSRVPRDAGSSDVDVLDVIGEIGLARTDTLKIFSIAMEAAQSRPQPLRSERKCVKLRRSYSCR